MSSQNKNSKKCALISLVGSGPGDPDLITVKAIERLKKAEIVFHDKLSPNTLIKRYCSPDVIVKDVGKRKGKVGPGQEEINRMLVEASKKYNRIVRLKGGDPFLFGRGGEEASHLARNGIQFEIIPGVSSLTGATAYAGIPVTDRSFSSSLTVITGHSRPGESENRYDWPALATSDTLVILMGITRAGKIAQKLVEAGKTKDTPVALIGWGTTPNQKTTITTLDKLSDGLDDPTPFLPGLIVVGEVVSLREQFNWFETLPLFGKKIIVTRPPGQAKPFSQQIRELGGKPIAIPTIMIEEIAAGIKELKDELSELDQYNWIIFTSTNGVKYFFETVEKAGLDSRVLGGIKIACIGRTTARDLKKHGLNADLVPEKYRAESLLDSFFEKVDSPANILLPRAKGARKILPDQLRENGHTVKEIQIYEAKPPGKKTISQLQKTLANHDFDMITFTSSSTVNNFFDMLSNHYETKKLVHDLEKKDVGAIGPITAKTLKSYGVSADVIPDQYTIDDFITAIKKYYLN